MRREFLIGAAAAVLAPRTLVAECSATSSASQGPYWRPGAPTSRDLRRFATDPVLKVRGRLLDARTCAPLAGRLEIWQADQHGKYDLDYGRGVTFGRASLGTEKDGTFEFVTTRPAPYGARPAHVHFIVSSGSRTLVTQLYFAGDPRLGSDPLQDVHDDLIVRPVRNGSADECVFDVRIA